jgi:hypothetical protein
MSRLNNYPHSLPVTNQVFFRKLFSRAESVGMMRALAPEGFLSLRPQQLGGAENENGEQGEIDGNQHV